MQRSHFTRHGSGSASAHREARQVWRTFCYDLPNTRNVCRWFSECAVRSGALKRSGASDVRQEKRLTASLQSPPTPIGTKFAMSASFSLIAPKTTAFAPAGRGGPVFRFAIGPRREHTHVSMARTSSQGSSFGLVQTAHADCLALRGSIRCQRHQPRDFCEA